MVVVVVAVVRLVVAVVGAVVALAGAGTWRNTSGETCDSSGLRGGDVDIGESQS